MYQLLKNFRVRKSFTQRNNFRVEVRKRLCRLKTFAKQKLSREKNFRNVKSFASKPVAKQSALPTAKKVDPLPLRGDRDKNFRFELLPLPKGFKKCETRLSVWFR